MAAQVWSRLVLVLTLLGAFFTLASWLGPGARMVLFVAVGLLAVQALPVYLMHVASLSIHRRRALESIEALRGKVTARLAVDPNSILELDLSGTDLAGLKWESLHALSRLESLDLSQTALTDEQLDFLSRLPVLRQLDLDGTAITDAGLVVLRGFPRLEFVSLTGTAITEEGLEKLFHSRPALAVEAGHLPPLDHLEPLRNIFPTPEGA